MYIKKTIASVLVLLLLVFGSNNFSYEVYASGGSTLSHLHSIPSSHVFATKISKTVLKKDHQRVRFMGGDCGYISPALVLAIHPAIHNAQRKQCFYSSFIADSCPVSFKLRGPPVISLFTVSIG